MSTHILLTTVEYGKPQSKYYAKASAGNAALAFDQKIPAKWCYQLWFHGIMPRHY